MADEEEEYIPEEAEFIPFKNRESVRIRRQFTACLWFFFGALGAGLQLTRRLRITETFFAENFVLLPDFLFYFPMLGDAVGIIAAVPLLYFFGCWYTLILTQAVTLVALFVSLIDYEKIILHNIGWTLNKDKAKEIHKLIIEREQFISLIVQHGCIRVFVISMVVYVVEVTQPSLRAMLLAAFYPLFIFGTCLSNVFLSREKAVLTAAFFIFCSFTLLWMAPESPNWLARKGNYEGARATFTRLRAGDDDADELEALLESTSSDAKLQPLLVGFGLALAKIAFLNMSTDNICRVFWSFATRKQFFFIYDNYLNHERVHFIYYDYNVFIVPLLSSLVFLLAISFFGRRILYLTSILVSLLAWFIRNKILTLNMRRWISISLQTCYFMTYMGAIQIVLIVSGEIFPGRVREVGVAASQLMHLGFQYLDYKWAYQESGKGLAETLWKENDKPLWDIYIIVRWTLLPLGLLMTYIFLPETKNLTLLEAEIAGAKMEPVVKFPFTKSSKEPEPGEENVGEENVGVEE